MRSKQEYTPSLRDQIKATVMLVKFIVSIFLIVGLVYKYREKLVEQLKKLKSRQRQFDTYVQQVRTWANRLESEIKKFEQQQAERDTAPRSVTAPKNKSSSKPKSSKSPFALNDRQEAVYALIRTEGEVSMAHIEKVIAGVTPRTLRRDVSKLEKLGLVEQVGKTKDTVYQIRK